MYAIYWVGHEFNLPEYAWIIQRLYSSGREAE